MHEGQGTKSCVIVGEYDVEQFCGIARVYAWNSPEGWSVYPFASRQEDRSSYTFELQNDDVERRKMKHAASSICKDITSEVKIRDIYDSDEDILRGLSDELLKEARNQMGFNPGGLPLYEGVMRDTYKGFIYLDGNFAPVTEAKVLHYCLNGRDRFQISNDFFGLEVITIEKEIAYISFGYQLGYYTDVDDRLYRFEIIKKYIESHNVYVRMVDHEAYDLSFDPRLPSKEWEENIEKTYFWMDQMRRISKIERYYDIKFTLPQKASEEEFLAIGVISDSIDKKSSRTLPPLPMKHPGFKKKLTLKEEIPIGNGVELPMLYMFSYSFRPVAEYILAGDYRWNKKEKGWEAVNIANGIPVRVEFEISFDDDRNRDLTQYIPYEEVRDEFDGKEIVFLESEDAQFFKEYIRITHDVQEIWQLFLTYKEQIDKFIEFDLGKGVSEKAQKQMGKMIDKITANELTNGIVYTGGALIQHIDDLVAKLDMDYKPDCFSKKWIGDNAGYAWMKVMRQYAIDGHFPVSVDDTGYCYYNMIDIEYQINQTDNLPLKEVVKLSKESFQDYYPDLGNIDLYSMLRNYMYMVALKQKMYYELVEPYLEMVSQKMDVFIAECPGLVISSGIYEDHVVYMVDGEDVLHAFRKDSDVMMDFYRFRQQAEKHYHNSIVGCKQTGYKKVLTDSVKVDIIYPDGFI